jgi:hypothetical protein
MIRLNKILFDLLLPFKEVRKGYHIVDGDLLPIFINELIAHSASQCCIPDNHHASGFVKGLPIAYRNVVSVVNSSKSYKKTVLLFEPLADIFLELIEDKYYISLCETSHAFGYEKNITYVKQKLNKIVKEILKNPAFKNKFNLGTKGIEINTQMPMPDSEMATTILAGNYLPPIIPIKATVKDSIRNCLDNRDI